MNYIAHYDSPLGGITLTSDGTALTGLLFDNEKYIEEMFGRESGQEYETKDVAAFAKAREWLDIYFSGKDPGFTPPIEVQATPFRRAVCEIMLTIPYGQTMTYGQIAEIIAARRGITRMAAQAVGGAVGHNPISLIIPCHRVVGTNGSLTGYGGGLDKKVRLLQLEGVDMSRFFMP